MIAIAHTHTQTNKQTKGLEREIFFSCSVFTNELQREEERERKKREKVVESQLELFFWPMSQAHTKKKVLGGAESVKNFACFRKFSRALVLLVVSGCVIM